MNTSKQLLRENAGNLAVHGNLISRAWRKVPEPTPAADARRKHRQFAVLIFWGIALVAYPLRWALAGLPRQEFEGLGAVACALGYVGIFLSRVFRALEQDSLQAETPDDAVALPVAHTSEPGASQEEHPAMQSEPRS